MKWTKLENQAGYPCYVENDTRQEQFDHPEFPSVVNGLKRYDNLKYTAYRIAFKTDNLQKTLQVPSTRLSAGVFSRHCLSLSESSLTLEASELEAVLTDIYFAAEKEGLFFGNVDKTVDFVLNLLLNVYDKERKAPIRVLAAKILLTLLNNDSFTEKWIALSNYCADHNNCISALRLTTLLTYVAMFTAYLGEDKMLEVLSIQADVDRCFAKSAGMLGMSSQAVVSWATMDNGIACQTTSWLSVLQRVQESRVPSNIPNKALNDMDLCSACNLSLYMKLRFYCTKCVNVFLCEECYLYDKDLSTLGGHKKTHLVKEIVDGEKLHSELGFMHDLKRLFICSTKVDQRRKKARKKVKEIEGEVGKENEFSCKSKTGVFTSTVGKASGHAANHPTAMLQDIIAQLESQNRVLKDLYDQLSQGPENANDDVLRQKVDSHYGHIATQINRLKILKDNLSTSCQNLMANKMKEANGLQAFDVFSPIPVVPDDRQLKTSNNLKNQPRVLSLDSGNFSVASKPSTDSQQLMPGDSKPMVVHGTTDSISTVSMNDISTWYGNDGDSTGERRRPLTAEAQHLGGAEAEGEGGDTRSSSLCVAEARFDAQLTSVADSNRKMAALNADLDTVLDRLQQILTHNFALDDSCFDNTQLRETASEMEGLLGTLIRGVEQRVTLNGRKNI